MFQAKVLEKTKTHTSCSATFSRKSFRLWDVVEKYRAHCCLFTVKIIRQKTASVLYGRCLYFIFWVTLQQLTLQVHLRQFKHHTTTYLPINPSIHLPTHSPTYLPIRYPSIHPSIHLFFHPSSYIPTDTEFSSKYSWHCPKRQFKLKAVWEFRWNERMTSKSKTCVTHHGMQC